MEKDQFEQANGFSNNYWGWGFEDVDLRERLLRNNIQADHRQGHFRKLPHVDEGSLPGGAPTKDHVKNKALYINQWFRKIDGGFVRHRESSSWKNDGLNDLDFTEVERRRPFLSTEREGIIFERVTVGLEF